MPLSEVLYLSMNNSNFKDLFRFCIKIFGFALSMWIISEMSDVYIQLGIAEYLNENSVYPTLEIADNLRKQSLMNLAKHMVLLFGGYIIFIRFSQPKSANEAT